MLMQNFGKTDKEYYGLLWYFPEWSIVDTLLCYVLDAMAYRGDLIGCTVNFDISDKVSVVFTLNGKQITQQEIFIDNPDRKPLYPYIGMARKGIRVLAKVLYVFIF